MAKKKTPQKNTKAAETIELKDDQASQVKGGLTYQKIEGVLSPRDPASGQSTGKR